MLSQGLFLSGLLLSARVAVGNDCGLEGPKTIAERFDAARLAEFQKQRDDRATEIWLEREVKDAMGKKAPVGFSKYEASRVPRSDVIVLWADGVDSDFRQAVEGAFFSGDFVLWPHHPDHQRSVPVPYVKAPREPWKMGHRTGSRSSIIRLDEGPVRYLGVKLPRGLTEGDPKANVSGDIQASFPTTNWMSHMDQSLAKVGRPLPNDVVMLRDLAAFVDPKSGNGFLVRDVRPITVGNRDGEFWLPAYSVEDQFPLSVGDLEKGIARVNAMMLVRYGYWHATPHNQQFVYQCPCVPKSGPNRTATRDLGDGKLYWPVLKALGEKELIEQERNSFGLAMQLDFHAREVLAPPGFVPERLFRAEVLRILEVDPSALRPGQSIDSFLQSPLGQAAIRRYHGLPQTLLPPLPNSPQSPPAVLRPGH